LGKRVVAQHIPVGGLLEWDVQEPKPGDSISPASPETSVRTQAPWASQSASTRDLGPMRSNSGLASRPMDLRSVNPVPPPRGLEESNPHVGNALPPLTSTRRDARSSVTTTALHSSAQRVQTHALTSGHRPSDPGSTPTSQTGQ